MRLRHVVTGIALLGSGLATAGQTYAIQRQFARGVYWPWERTKIHAEHAGMEFWEFVDHMMGRIADEWVVQHHLVRQRTK